MGDITNRLKKYSIIRQSVYTRPPNRGGAITDNLRTPKTDPEEMDLYTEIEPLRELIPLMSNKLWLILRIEIPKWFKRGKLIRYGGGMIGSIIRMKFGQPLTMPRKKPPDNHGLLKEEIKEYARSLGFISGFTMVDRRFISRGDDSIFPYDTALVLGMEMDRNLIEEIPKPGKRLFDFEIYVRAGRLVFEVAKFIRGKGWRCHVRIPTDGGVKYPPHAVMAGLGQLGAQGVVITKEFGPRVRWCMISIDAEIEPDPPIDLNLAEYCEACRLCVRSCPGKAISSDPVWWRGVLKRKINDTKCYPYFRKYDGCGLCIKVCPIGRYGYEKCMAAFMKDGGRSARIS